MKINNTFLRYVILLAIVLALFVLGVYFAWTRRYALITNDAFVQAHVIALAPQEIKGRVIAVNVSDFATVKKGQILFQIDPRTYQDEYNAATANLAMATDHTAYLQDLVQNAQLSINIANANLVLAQKHYQEKLPLAKKGYVTIYDLSTLRDALIAAQNQIHLAQENLISAKHNLGSTIGGVNVRVLAAQSALAIAKRHLDETTVRAPVDGYITNSSLRVGDYLNTGESKMSLIDTHTWQVYAYYQETAVGRLHVGEKVKVKLFMYPSIKTSGKIVAIERGSSRSPATPGDNNLRFVQPEEEWILLPQRFLVYIDFDWPYPNKPLQVGATCYVTAEPG